MTPRTQSSKKDHKHDTPEKKLVAESGIILLTQVGSPVHGINVKEQDDRDEMGICLEPPKYVCGLQRFEQYEYRTAGIGNRSGPGDLDLVVYGARKWMSLALKGNPTVLLPLYVPESEIVTCTPLGRGLRGNRSRIVSRDAGCRFLGYLRAQRDRLEQKRSPQDGNRTDLIEQYGFDVKFAAHMIRLGYQGLELMRTGEIPVPIPEEWQRYCRSLRRGGVTKEDALDTARSLERELVFHLDENPNPLPVPRHGDREWANEWLTGAYTQYWEENGFVSVL